MSIELITILMFGLMLLLLAAGLPIVFVLGGTALFFGICMWGTESMYVVAANANETIHARLLVAVPLFVFMAYMLESSGIAEELYAVMYRWMGPLHHTCLSVHIDSPTCEFAADLAQDCLAGSGE